MTIPNKVLMIRKLKGKREAHSYAHCTVVIEVAGGDPTIKQLKEAFEFFRDGGEVITLLPEHECI